MTTQRKSSQETKSEKKKPSISETHAKAPQCARFVTALREVFGEDQVIVLMVNEGEIKFGRKT